MPVRNLSDIERELAEARAVIDHPSASYDNDGNLMTTAAERAASYRARHARLTEEHQQLLSVLGIRQATHPLYGTPLEWPIPAPLRKFAIWDADQPCREHSVAYSGGVPCTGDIRCRICGTRWNEDGDVFTEKENQ